MDIRSFTPQTQRTLARMDTNRDNQLSVRELGSLKNVPTAPGIASKDLAVIQESLKKTTGPSQIIVPLVDDQPLPPRLQRPGTALPRKARRAPCCNSPSSPDPGGPSGTRRCTRRQKTPGPRR